VHVFTNGDEVELLLNGQSLGRQSVPVEPGGEGVRCRRLEFKVVHAPGTLEARAYRKGRVWATDGITTTTGVPAAVGLVVDWPLLGHSHAVLEADGRDVALIDARILDADGRVIETPASHRGLNFTLSFSSSGPSPPTLSSSSSSSAAADSGGGRVGAGSSGGARILGVGNGDPSCHEPDALFETPLAAWRSAFMGHARVLVQSGRAEGFLTLTATSPGLAPATMTLVVRSDKVRDTRALASSRQPLEPQPQRPYQEIEVATAAAWGRGEGSNDLSTE
jgi:beta-galactosidase